MSNRDYAYVISLVVGGILAASLIFFLIAGKQLIQLPACIIYEKTGFYCPGCGGTRSVLALLQGDFLKSLWYHPVVLYTVILYLTYLCTETGERVFSVKRRIPDHFWKNSIYSGLLLLAAHMIVRNILKFGFQIPL